ncbi:hypothetical protein JL722_7360 [Aureococcus anophagefferens]|nr:hypothetical protein JL722_7360 [Aureococcus anophagefferens]
MGCNSSRALDAAADARLETLKTPRLSRRLSKGTSFFAGGAVSPSVSKDDDKLEKLNLPLNGDILEDELITEEEEAFLRDEIEPRLGENAAAILAAFDETSRVRIFRGMITNNKGPMDARVKEAVEAYGRLSAWLAENGDVLAAPRAGEAVVAGAMGTTLGGVDLYGHVVWAEKLGDIGAVVDVPVSEDDAKAIRLKTMEAIRCAQIRACERRGPQRYKQVYIVDLGAVSLTSLMSRGSVRAMTAAIITGANAYYPETLWKMFLVNAPWSVRSVYAMISPMIHEVTKAKIKILGGPSKYLPELEKNGVPRAAVPKSLGGGCDETPLAKLIAELVADGFRARRGSRRARRALETPPRTPPRTPRTPCDPTRRSQS